VEIAAKDRQYAWDKVDGAEGFHRVTVFPNGNYHDKTAREIRKGVFRALDRINPVVVATNGWSVPEARSGLAWSRRRKRRCVLMSETKADDHRRLVWKELVKRFILKKVDAALVGGRSQADYLTNLGFPRKRIHLGYDVVDNAFFAGSAAKSRANRDHLRPSLGLPKDFFFACTRFLPRKNIDGLLRAYSLYRTRATKPLWGLVIAGSGDEEGRLHTLERELGLQGVVWPGFVQYSELPVYFGLAGAFVHPAKSEPWGLVVNEAAASGTPLLISRTVGATYELVRDGENGFLFDPTNVEEIARTLLKVASMTVARREAMGLQAQQIASAWGPERFASGLLAAAEL
jgi:glycosyltransferase involved in cell wall biosynthesis